MAGSDSYDYLWRAPVDGVSGSAGREPATEELLNQYHDAVMLRDKFSLLRIIYDNSNLTFDAAFTRLRTETQSWIVKLLKDGP